MSLDIFIAYVEVTIKYKESVEYTWTGEIQCEFEDLKYLIKDLLHPLALQAHPLYVRQAAGNASPGLLLQKNIFW